MTADAGFSEAPAAFDDAEAEIAAEGAARREADAMARAMRIKGARMALIEAYLALARLSPAVADGSVAQLADAAATRRPGGFCSIWLDELRDEAGVWADYAHPLEIAAYAAAALQRLDAAGVPALGEAARKRLLVVLWQGMPAEWQRAFLARVDPRGRFRAAPEAEE
ncbi:MAG: hypothetical protein H5U20_07680 [Rhodobacteraceae bacterium]|nr:hypothetical protein [Paracoccaceae bacterium]